ncbi:hypothetical protein ACPD8N_11740 [Lacticaseibacillus chiayiensis]|uniref:Uncharacterized protein n=1 Tax=Lacticaseibacillus chiayiensis TaxID=2100821 RepID=A0ABY6H8X3_9LACO|nr:hypothetical protein [Lacticaseibacillus chiayiensis]UYN57818.1 hypothetical protein OFW50_04460 [Lacticaseibacillus chiayiensis]
MDEMEHKFLGRSTGYAYVFLLIVLSIYNLIQLSNNRDVSFTSFVLITSVAIQWGGYEWFKHKADQTDKEPGQILYITIVLTAILFIFGLVALMFHGK